MNEIKIKISQRIDQLEILLMTNKYQQASDLLPEITKFTPILTEEQRDFINAAKFAINKSLDWTDV